MSMWRGRIGFAALVMSVVGGSAAMGCAGERDPINRVQPGAYDKSFFLGDDLQDFKDDPEFRTKSYQIDSPANTSGFGSTIGLSGAVDRIRWDISGDGTLLFARRSYQESPGADNKALPKVKDKDGRDVWQGPANGSIIAAFKIESHFDIRRDYNPGTGEEGNVIVENSSDRPWYQRQFMRVDWSQNHAESTSGDTGWVFGGGAKASPITYAVTNELDEDYPKFEPQNGYIDVTAKYQVENEIVPSWGVPECVIVGFLNGTTSWDCTPTEVKIRHSFVRLTGKEDFEPFEESLAHRDIVGNWGNAGNTFNREYGAPPITSYDPQYGFTDANTKTFYAHHNIWEKAHQDKACGSNADDNNDGTADACENSVTQYQGFPGSQCDRIIGKCTIPVRDRQVKTIGYWLNADAPTDLQDETSSDGKTITRPGPIEQTYVTWNQLLKVAVATRREVECRRTLEGTRDECHDLYFDGTGAQSKEMVAFGGWGIDKVKEQGVDKDAKTGKTRQLMVTCHNPVRAYDDVICGKPSEVIRLGDIRKNYGIYWPYWSRAGYGGVATIGADPLTGEMLGVSATTMMRSVTFAAAQVRDIIQIALGDVKIEDLIEGSQQSRFADLVKNGKVSTEFGSKPRTADELADMVNNIDLPAVQAATGVDGAKVREAPRKFAKLEKAKQDRMLSPTAPAVMKANQQVEALANRLKGTEYTTSMANRGLTGLLSQIKGDAKSPLFNVISTMASQDPSKIQDLMDSYQAWLGSRGICFMDSEAMAGAGSIYLPSLAPYFKKLYGNLDPKTRGVKIYQDLQREIVNGIAFHEVGHSMGMRHNFASSWDSQNYAPQYWQLRTGDKKITDVEICKAPRSGGTDSCMGPRYSDPPSDDELGQAGEARPGIEYFANTSTMEYQIERFGETVGAGTYDLHFMKTIYGRVLETLDERQITPDDQPFFAVKTLSQGINDELVYDQDKGFGVHYTKAARLAKVFDPARDCRPATEEEKATAKWRIVHGKVCAPSPKNHLAYEDMKTSEISFKLSGSLTPVGVDGIRWNGKDYGAKGKSLVRWHYRYGEDYSRGGYLHAKLFDSGADVYEITSNVIKRFELTYPWSYFRRQNKEFAWWSLPSAVRNNTFSRIRGYHWNTTINIGRAQPQDLADDDKDRGNVVAAQDMWDFLQRAIVTVEPGTYGSGADTTRRTPKRAGAITIYDVMTDSEAGQPGKIPAATVGIPDGRFIQIDFDNRKGGSWDYQAFPQHVGFDEEKVLAMIELTDSRPTLSTVSRDNALDARGVHVSFRTDTPHAIDRLVGGILAEDFETFAPSADTEGKITNFSLTAADSTKLLRPANAKVLFPNVGYENQVGTLIYALLFSRSSTDMVLSNKMRVRFENDTGPVITDDKKVAFTDPVTGYRYVATKFGTETIQGRAVETGIASRMIQRANELLAQTYSTTGLPNAFGEPTLTLKDGKPVPTADQTQLRRYVGLLDVARQLGKILGSGPLGGGGDGGGDE
jgi:hypothetical protein